MKKLVLFGCLVAMVAGIGAGCSYGSVVVSGDKAIVPVNNAFFGGVLRKIYVCKITDSGLTSCQKADSP